MLDAAIVCPDDVGTITVSGGLSGTRATSQVQGLWVAFADLGAVNVTGLVPESPFMAALVFTFSGEPRPGAYSESMPGVDCYVTAALPPPSQTPSWAFETGEGSPRPEGACSLSLTSVTTVQATKDGKSYCVHGSIAATLTGATDAQAPVSLAASF